MVIKEANPPASEEFAFTNSQAEIEKRLALGQVSWTGPLLLVTSRTVLAVVAQAIVAFIYVLRRNPSPWQAATPWWSIYGTLVDIGCLALMTWFTRGEGIRLRDLVGRMRLRWGRDIFIGNWVPSSGLPVFRGRCFTRQQTSIWLYTTQSISGITGRASVTTLGDSLQLERMVACLVPDRADDVPGICTASHPGAVWE
jgi:hypothetical protein